MVCKVKYEEPCSKYCTNWVCVSEEELKLIDQERVFVDFSNEMIRIPLCAYNHFIAKRSMEKSILSHEEEAFLRPLMKKALGLAPEEEENEAFEEHWARFKELLRQQELQSQKT